MESDSDHSQVILGPKLEKKLPKTKINVQESTSLSKEEAEEYDDLDLEEGEEDQGEEEDIDDIDLGDDEEEDIDDEEGEEEADEEDLEGYDEEQPEEGEEEQPEEDEEEFIKEKPISPKKEKVKMESPLQPQIPDKVKIISPKPVSPIQKSPTFTNSSLRKSGIIPIQESFVKDSMIQHLIDPEKALPNPLSTFDLQNKKTGTNANILNQINDGNLNSNTNSRNNSKNPSPKFELNKSNSSNKSNRVAPQDKSSPLKSSPSIPNNNNNNNNNPNVNINKTSSPKPKIPISNSKIDIHAVLGSQKSVKSITVSEEEEEEEEPEEQEYEEDQGYGYEEDDTESITTERKPLRNSPSESRTTSMERPASNQSHNIHNTKSQKKNSKSVGNVSKLIATLGKEREELDKSRKAQINNAKKIKQLTKNLKKERKQLIQDQKKQEEAYRAKLEREKALEKAKLEEESSELVIEEKEYILHELWKYEKLGYKPRKKLSMKHTLRQLRFELYRIKQSEKLENRVNNAYDMFDSVNAGIELLNVKWKPFGIELTGWSDTVGTQEDEYKRILRKMFRYYEFEFIDRPMVQFGLRLGTQFVGFVAPRIIEKLTGTVQVDKTITKKESEKDSSKETLKMMEAIINNQTQAQEFNKQLAAILVSQQKSMSTLEEKMQSLSSHTVYQMQQQPMVIKDSRVEELESYTKKNPLTNFDINVNQNKKDSNPIEEKSMGKKIAEDDEWEYYEVEDNGEEEAQPEQQIQPQSNQPIQPIQRVQNVNYVSQPIAEIPKTSVLNSPFGMFTSHPALSKLSGKLNRIKNGKTNETEVPESDSSIQLPEKFKTNAVASSVINL